MTIATILITLLIAEIFLILVGRKLILKLARKLGEALDLFKEND